MTPKYILIFSLVLLGAHLAPVAEAAAKAKKDKSGTLTTWIASGSLAGQETLRVVRTESGKHYASGTVRGAGKNALTVLTHQERDPKGILNKYRRKEKVRLGKGLFAFRSSASVRIKGLNQNFPMAYLEGAARHLLWDPEAWHTLAHWTPRLAKASGESVDLRYFDVDRRRMGKAIGTIQSPAEALDPKGKKISLIVWSLQGLGPPEQGGSGGAWSVSITSEGSLVEVAHSGRTLVREGWSMDVPVDEPEQPQEEEEAPQEPLAEAKPEAPPVKDPVKEETQGEKVPEEPTEPAPDKGEVGDGP